MLAQILANIRFELKIRARSISSYVYFLMFFALSLFMALAAGGAIPGATVDFGAGTRVYINSSTNLSLSLAFLTSFSLFIAAPVFGQAACKDFLNNIDQVIYSTPIKIKCFLLGRFLGALLFHLFVLSSIALGTFIATQVSLIFPSMIGPNQLSTYLLPYLTVALPNAFIMGAIFFSVASLTKKMTPVYISAVLFFLLWGVSGQLTSGLDNKVLATLLDPFGIKSIAETGRYWTVHQKNYQMLGLEGYFLWNRILWVILSAILFTITVFSFSSKKGKIKKEKSLEINELPKALPVMNKLSNTPPHWLSVFFQQLKFEFFQIVKSIYFFVILLAGTGYMFISGTQVGKMFETKTYPVTYNILDFMGGVFSLFILIIITLYIGESIWRDRDLRINQIVDALPTPNFVFFAAKYINLVLITILLLTVIMFSGIIVQLSYGYTHFEIPQYLTRLYLIELPNYINLISLIFFIQIVFRNKYLAHGLVILFYIVDTFAVPMGFEHYLYLFNKKPSPIYSDMNQYGHLFKTYHIYNTYWLFFSGILVILAYLLWQRGTEPKRLKTVHFKYKSAISLLLLGFISLGSYLFYQTNIVNEYKTKKTNERESAAYERQYQKFNELNMPVITSVVANVDIYPSQLKLKANLEFSFKNEGDTPIDQVLVNLPEKKSSFEFSIPAQVTVDDILKVAIYQFESPLRPGQEFQGFYSVLVDQSAIRTGNNINKINYNGTFFNNFDYFPVFGYQVRREINDSRIRGKYSLPPKTRRPDIDSQKHWQENLLGNNGHWIDFETIVSTDKDQIAIAPGYIQKEWIEGERKYFHYKMDQKILNFYAFLSGRYEIIRDKWNDVDIEIYYHKGHEYNLERMLNSTKMSLEYFTEHFGPYQHRQYRIIEFPRYQSFAQSFPNTIPFSEGVGFIARIDDAKESDIDYPFYITSHELAHQWWPHQMIGANVQGADTLSESLSQYSALMVMERQYGREKMKKFLQHELDNYLFGRGQEREYENPLYRSEDQAYIHYNKGSLSFYALKDYLGEDILNAALREALQSFSRTAPPYMTMKDLIAIIKDKAPDDKKQIVTDLLEEIVVFENRPLKAQAIKMEDGRYQIELIVYSQKFYSDKTGKETTQDFAQEIDIGVLDKNNQYLYLKKHLLRNGENTIELIVEGDPARAGIDPLNILVDKNSDDNLMAVSVN